jgi:hypothetical protein
VETVVSEAEKRGEFLAICLPLTDENEDQPWAAPPSRRHKDPPIIGPLPEQIDLVLGNQVYVPKTNLIPSLRNPLIRLAAFQNPEFYQAQAMRLSTFGKPRIIRSKAPFRAAARIFPNTLDYRGGASTNWSTYSVRSRST